MFFKIFTLDNYSIIESELKNAFKKHQIQKEWYEFDFYGVDKNKVEHCIEIKQAIDLYSRTDPNCKMYKKIYSES